MGRPKGSTNKSKTSERSQQSKSLEPSPLESQLVSILAQHASESGEEEGVVDTLARIIKERDFAQLELAELTTYSATATCDIPDTLESHGKLLKVIYTMLSEINRKLDEKRTTTSGIPTHRLIEKQEEDIKKYGAIQGGVKLNVFTRSPMKVSQY